MCDHLEGEKHNCEYLDWRDSKIDRAAALADYDFPEPDEAPRDTYKSWSVKWDAAFHRAMKCLTTDPFELAREGRL